MTQRKGPYSQNSEESLPILGVQIHGDAAIAGQGIVTETLAMSGVPHFSTDGSIHCVVNNQIGFTTPGDYCGRTSHYCSDVMKIIDAPCIHVNADFPEEVLKATRLALDYRNAFNKDILIDLVCYRQWGHNELDDPTFTNPLMYKAIHSRSETIAHKYAKQVLTSDEIESVKQQFWQHLNDEFKVSSEFTPLNTNLKGVWSKMVHPSHENVTLWNTGFPVEQLTNIGVKSVEIPSTFKLHPTLNKSLVADRIKRIQETKQIEWSTAECLAFGSLLLEGNNIRISGQDVDQETGELYIPLNNLSKAQSGHLEIANSILSEEAVLGYEYGMSIDSPKNLIIWEAQFGDFFNGAQIILDTFVSSGELKWLLQSSMVILLPHGYDGAGPEHSSCRIERFLQMCDSSFQSVDSDAVNWCVANPTTPAQYFHLLRRQMVRNYRKPIVIASPKLLLRHPECISHLDDFDNGTHFQAVIDDRTVSNANNVKK
ncbi:putative 2-oxoglutarate dehydrogenase E1 component DHKTD1-like protein, partial [Leptotrombidium deliense]